MYFQLNLNNRRLKPEIYVKALDFRFLIFYGIVSEISV